MSKEMPIKRWRCIKTIEATKRSKEVREAFGRTVTEKNKAEARNKVKGQLNPEMVRRGGAGK